MRWIILSALLVTAASRPAVADWKEEIEAQNKQIGVAWMELQDEIARTKIIKGDFTEEEAILTQTEKFQTELFKAMSKFVGLAKTPADSATMVLNHPLTLDLGGETVRVGGRSPR